MPAYLLNQPDDHQIGELLKKVLADRLLVRFDALVAFAVSSGVRQLQTELEIVLARGGSVRIVVGVSNRVTTAEGLRLLLDLTQKGAVVFVFHNDSAANPIFHPKMYVGLGGNAGVLIVGSSNLTGKGLFGNYEISLVQDLDLTKKADAALLASAEKIIEKYCDVASGFSRVLDEKFFRELDEAGYLGSEARATNRPETSGESDDSAVPAVPKRKLFASKGVPQPPITKPTAASAATTPSKAAARAPLSSATSAVAAATIQGKGPLVWEKQLKPSDTQTILRFS